MSQDINQDPEVWAFTDQFGDRALRVWLEILAIADRNEGLIGMTLDSITTAVAYKCRCKTTRVRLMLDWIMTQGWVQLDSGLRVRNFSKYHRTREPNRLPSEPSEPSLPSKPKKSSVAVATDPAFDAFWNQYPRKVAKDKARRAWVKGKCNALQEKILTALESQKQQPQWLKDNGEFIPHAATWLNQRRWDDEQEAQIFEKPSKTAEQWIAEIEARNKRCVA